MMLRKAMPTSTERKPKYCSRGKKCVLAVSLCLIAGAGGLALTNLTREDRNSGYGNSDSFWGTRDYTLLEIHRDDFTPGLSAEAEAAFAHVPVVMKVYRTIPDAWFLAEELTDFSQALDAEPFYIVPGSSEGIGGPSDAGAYSVYALDENGEPHWGMGVSSPDNDTVPYTFCGLTWDIIEEDLAGVDYDDIIISHSTRLYTVFIWARCSDGQDRFVTYPARPEFVKLENRGRYTLNEIRQILSEAYCGP